MTHGDRLLRLITLLEQRGLLEKHKNYLLTPDYVQDIITATNENRKNDALSAIRKAEQVLSLVWDYIDSDDREWFVETMRQLRQSVLSASE